MEKLKKANKMKVNKDKDIDNEIKQKFNEWKYNVLKIS